ncbi:MAG: PhzF family phenazine biosynthesis isomerase [Solirubrobacterales bacterium]|nr:PhzF family phenazine biosynthesis isomerase [Solirubrobacterales bacterium]
MPELLRYTAFPDAPHGGNPAGVVLDAIGLDPDAMLAIAADLGFSETAFVVARETPGTYDVRYFAPDAEVPFCGHATIATAVALAARDGAGPIALHTAAGLVAVETSVGPEGTTATLTSVPPSVEEPPEGLVPRALAALGWSREELDPELPPRVAFAGARHLVLGAATRERLARLDYDFEALRALCLEHDLITVDLVWREDATTFHARNPFPVGGVVEDPATGAAAAAFGGYLRALGLLTPPAEVTVLQGVDMGRPSRLVVGLDPDVAGVRVRGTARVLSA